MISDEDDVDEEDDDDLRFAVRSEILPSDVLGRVACVLAGALFATLGGGGLALLILGRRGIDACVFYELSIVALLLGVCYLLWGCLAPAWLERVAQDVQHAAKRSASVTHLPSTPDTHSVVDSSTQRATPGRVNELRQTRRRQSHRFGTLYRWTSEAPVPIGV